MSYKIPQHVQYNMPLFGRPYARIDAANFIRSAERRGFCYFAEMMGETLELVRAGARLLDRDGRPTRDRQPFFRCPRCGKRRRSLYHLPEEVSWGCRVCLNLRYHCQSMNARTRKKRRQEALERRALEAAMATATYRDFDGELKPVMQHFL